MLEKGILLEKDASLLCENQLEVILNQLDLTHTKNICLNLLFEKLFH